VQSLLGEAVAASVLLASTLKFEGSLILQVRGDGPLEILMVECNNHLEVRAIAQVGESWHDEVALWPLSMLFGNGQLAITIEPEQGERYQGIGALGRGVAGGLSGALLCSVRTVADADMAGSGRGCSGRHAVASACRDMTRARMQISGRACSN
jgi:molecular chaperone Hsp33